MVDNMDSIKKNLELRKTQIKNIDQDVYMYSMGKTACIGAIRHVMSQHPRSKTSPYGATIMSRYNMLPGSCTPRATRQYSKGRTIEINNLITSSFSTVLPLHLYPRTQIYLLADMIQLDGGSRTCAINCISYCLLKLKLPHIGIPLAVAYGLNSSKELVLDLNYQEDSKGFADCPVVFNMPSGKLINLQMEGEMTCEQFIRGFNAAYLAIEKLYNKNFKEVESNND